MNNHSSPIIEALDVRKDYLMPAGRLAILKGVNLALRAGDVAFVVGRSGSGKSTLLHLLGGLDQATSGKILFEGQDITQWNESGLARFRNRRIGFVFQFYHLLPELTVYENVLLPMLIAGKSDRIWIREILRRVKLLSRKEYYPNELSGGEKQRVAIARALANKPSIVFCDEPTGNLDDETAETVFSLLTDLNRKDGHSFLIVTHDENLAWRYLHPVYRLHDGVLVKEERGQVENKPAPEKPNNRNDENKISGMGS